MSYADTITLTWIRDYLRVLLLLVVGRLSFLLLFPAWGSFGDKFWYYLFFGMGSCYIALAGFIHLLRTESPRIISPGLMEKPIDSSPEPNPEILLQKPRLQALMKRERLYEDPALTLTDLAKALNLSRKQTSHLINRGFGLNFNDFVNRYRVEATKERFSQGEHRQLTILGVALAAGFNSKTTFNRVFKRETGQTPRQYLSELEDK